MQARRLTMCQPVPPDYEAIDVITGVFLPALECNPDAKQFELDWKDNWAVTRVFTRNKIEHILKLVTQKEFARAIKAARAGLNNFMTFQREPFEDEQG